MISDLLTQTDNSMKKTLIVLILISAFFGCKKNQLGGNALIEGTVKHHEKVITDATVFIKFDATDQPSGDTTDYDAKVRVDKNGYFKFEAFKGSYFIYGHGHDPAIVAPYTVVGGRSVKLRSKETVSVNLFVTEGD
jgi:hypothetical protein